MNVIVESICTKIPKNQLKLKAVKEMYLIRIKAILVRAGSFLLISITKSFNEVAALILFIVEKGNGLKLVEEVFRKLNAKLIQIVEES